MSILGRNGSTYPIHLIVRDNTFSQMKTVEIYKGKPGEPVVERTTFGWITHGGDCMYCGDVSTTRCYIVLMCLAWKTGEKMINWMFTPNSTRPLFETRKYGIKSNTWCPTYRNK
jgi:hypothetical protein